ncbi:MAG TPA: DUF5522 domain-containing protein [Candidatus Angelobacter sp.]|nr:DUF5522 domain-containing protein [Candidatus Angelobacter sp.]
MSNAPKLLEGEDYYLENGYYVFTEKYLLQRGHCCRSGCRHCPYGFVKEKTTDK